MGLDMYLYKKTYIGNNYKDKDEIINIIFEIPEKNLPLNDKKDINNIKVERVSEIIETVGYWRKANQIHGWLVENIQDGKDECQETYFSREDMEKLLEVVKTVLDSSKLISGKVYAGESFKNGRSTKNYEDGEVIEDSTVAKKLLPTRPGFFFGDDGYDKYYIENLKYTKKLLEECLTENGDYYYQSSW